MLPKYWHQITTSERLFCGLGMFFIVFGILIFRDVKGVAIIFIILGTLLFVGTMTIFSNRIKKE